MLDGMRQRKDQAALFLSEGQWEAALAEYQALAREAPADLGLRQKVAEVLRRLGRKAEAVAAYLEAAEAWAERGHVARARALARVVLGLDAAHARAQALLAELAGRSAEALGRGTRGPRTLLPLPELPVDEDALRFEADGPLVQLGEGTLACVPLLSALSPESQCAVLAGARLRTVPEGALLLTRGQEGRTLHLLLDGRCTAFHAHVDGKETHYRELGAGDVLGEVSLLLGTPVTASVRATEVCTVLELDRDVVERLTRDQPALGVALWRLATERRLRTARLLSVRPAAQAREDGRDAA